MVILDSIVGIGSKLHAVTVYTAYTYTVEKTLVLCNTLVLNINSSHFCIGMLIIGYLFPAVVYFL